MSVKTLTSGSACFTRGSISLPSCILLCVSYLCQSNCTIYSTSTASLSLQLVNSNRSQRISICSKCNIWGNENMAKTSKPFPSSFKQMTMMFKPLTTAQQSCNQPLDFPHATTSFWNEKHDCTWQSWSCPPQWQCCRGWPRPGGYQRMRKKRSGPNPLHLADTKHIRNGWSGYCMSRKKDDFHYDKRDTETDPLLQILLAQPQMASCCPRAWDLVSLPPP